MPMITSIGNLSPRPNDILMQQQSKTSNLENTHKKQLLITILSSTYLLGLPDTKSNIKWPRVVYQSIFHPIGGLKRLVLIIHIGPLTSLHSMVFNQICFRTALLPRRYKLLTPASQTLRILTCCKVHSSNEVRYMLKLRRNKRILLKSTSLTRAKQSMIVQTLIWTATSRYALMKSHSRRTQLECKT